MEPRLQAGPAIVPSAMLELRHIHQDPRLSETRVSGGAPQDEAGLTRKFETSHVGGATVPGAWLASAPLWPSLWT